ncbi:oligosaccharide flippase family protein [Maribacter ulvicola]|uniref:Membrane protein involved in the export of O-antigen and teichoic acid n=1 Tax=Maribacter ulvicola TaxID=228959 RepID=A0A1N6PJ70_9FLAO|nr:oligosaccharide flippase family protein [Maribacter ulvicola]SIQ04259.1 Membrane protein involved in the export of O-antigen and teichoic acid [Maribacter ulvicola]
MSYIKAFKSISLLWLSSILGSGSTFILYAILARRLGPQDFGLLSNALAIISVILLICGFGISKTWLKLFGKEGWVGLRWIRPSLKLLGLNLIVFSILIICIDYTSLIDEVSSNLFRIMLFHIYGYCVIELIISKLQLEEKYIEMAIWQLIPNLLRLITVIIIVYVFNLSINVQKVGFIYGIIGAILTFFGFKQLIDINENNFSLKGHIKPLKISYSIPKIKELFNESWPFGMAGLFAFIYLQSDIIMVKYISGDMATGHYNVAFIVLSAVFVVPVVIFSKFLMPKYHRWSNQDMSKLHKAYIRGNLSMLIIGFILMIIIFCFAPYFTPIIFGIEYEPAVQLLQILSITIPIYFVAYSVGAMLITSEQMKLKVKLMGGIAVINVIANLILIPLYGNIGAASATILSNAILLLLYWIFVNKNVFNQINLK